MRINRLESGVIVVCVALAAFALWGLYRAALWIHYILGGSTP